MAFQMQLFREYNIQFSPHLIKRPMLVLSDVIPLPCWQVSGPVSVHKQWETIQHCLGILLQTIHWDQPGNVAIERTIQMQLKSVNLVLII